MIKISKKKRIFYLKINKIRTFNAMQSLKVMAWYLASLMVSNEIVPSAVP